MRVVTLSRLEKVMLAVVATPSPLRAGRLDETAIRQPPLSSLMPSSAATRPV
jgi:hypothetical protein